KVLPATLDRQVIIAQGQTRRRVETCLRMLAVRPGTDTQEAQQAKNGDQAAEIIYIHGASNSLPEARNCGAQALQVGHDGVEFGLALERGRCGGDFFITVLVQTNL